jgi:hypothetical protein
MEIDHSIEKVVTRAEALAPESVRTDNALGSSVR